MTMNPTFPNAEPAMFNGYLRDNGRVGTRNHLGVFIVGNCAATAARKVADWFTDKRLSAFPNVNGVVPFIHELGCGMEKSGEPMDLLRRTLGGGIRNPNLAGAVVLALGCERNNIYAFLEQEGLGVGPMLQSIVLQEVGGTAKAIEAGITAIEAMLPQANRIARQRVSSSHLTVGVQANEVGDVGTAAQAALGAAVDLLVANGGTAILSGTANAAPALTARSAAPAIAEQMTQRIQWWKGYTAGRDTRSTRHAASQIEPVAFAGSTPVQGVYGYGHAVQAKGLVFMDSPGYEAVSATGQVASGATMVCVVTRTGSAFGAPAVPTVKLAVDSNTFRQMEEDLDIDCGPAADGDISAQEMGQRIFDRWLTHASGQLTKSEELGVGDNEFVPWPVGVFA